MSIEMLALGAKFIGGLMNSSAQNKGLKLDARKLQMQQGQFDQQMDHSISRRVADAKRAGIHPLFAMGGSSGASPTITAGGGGGSRRSAGGDALTSMAQSLGLMEMNKASARRDEAEAALMDSERARIEQEALGRGHDSTVKTYPYGGDEVQLGPATYFSPEVPLSKSPGIRAGTAPGTIDVLMPDGRKINIYDPDLGLDEIAQVDAVYQRAIHVGADAMMAVRNFITRRLKKSAAEWKKLGKVIFDTSVQATKSRPHP